jgi:hypothetical protein
MKPITVPLSDSLRLASEAEKPRPTCYRLTIEAVGLTKGMAVNHALRLIAEMIVDPSEKGHSVGGETGNATGKFEAMTR